mgnify:CR=1 FL=1
MSATLEEKVKALENELSNLKKQLQVLQDIEDIKRLQCAYGYYLERWMSEQLGTRAFFKRMRHNLPVWSEKLPELPSLMHDFFQKANKGKLEVRWRSDELENIRREIKQANQRTVAAVAGGALLVSAAVLLGLDGYAPTMIGGAPLGTWILGGLGVILLGLAVSGHSD